MSDISSIATDPPAWVTDLSAALNTVSADALQLNQGIVAATTPIPPPEPIFDSNVIILVAIVIGAVLVAKGKKT